MGIYGDPTTDPPLPKGWSRKTVWDKLIKPGLVGDGMDMPEARSVKNFAEEKAEKLIESFLHSLRDAVWQATYERQKTWGRMSDEDFQAIFVQAFTECGMKFLMDNPRITRYINEISLYAFDRFRMDMQKTNTLRRSQIRTYTQDLRKLGDDEDVAL